MKLEVLKCPDCGANIEFEEGATSCECEYCGAVITIAPSKNTSQTNPTPIQNIAQKTAHTFNLTNKKAKKADSEGLIGKTIRKVFNILFFVCLFLTGFSIIMLFTDTDAMGFGIVAFFAIYTVMFKVLSLTPKKSKYILGKPKGLKPVYFVMICVLLSFAVIMTSATSSEDLNATDSTTDTSIATDISVN